MLIHPWCIATVTTAKAIEALTENAAGNPEQSGTFRDAHPWLVARSLWMQATAAGETVPLLLAAQEESRISFSHCGLVTGIDVLTKQLGGHESACRFTRLSLMNPIWHDIDSVALKPAPEQLERERLENLHAFRFHLTPQLIRPYAICETPAFLLTPSS